MLIPDERQTIETYLLSWLAVIKHQIRPSTYRLYEQYVRVHFIPALGKIPLARLTANQVQQFYARKLSDKLSPTTVNHLHSALHQAYDNALRAA
ncbi:MAG: phage integrase N-terminal SAM-like domain-containing protein [Ktedonobacterales bacterium]|nr:phage integrase N-terminal SAM-like domain-containing protein [Ktedonobacterales bacterium]